MVKPVADGAFLAPRLIGRAWYGDDVKSAAGTPVLLPIISRTPLCASRIHGRECHLMNSPRAQVGISRRREVCRREVFTGKITSPPRVRITHDVEVGGAIEMKELPFVLGVLGDFWQSEEALRVLRP